MTDDDMRWLAGVFDVRGGVTAYWSRGTKKKPKRKWNFVFFVDCVRPGVIDAVKAAVGGGCVHVAINAQPHPEGWKASARNRYVTSGARARGIVTMIRPFVKARAEEIDHALALDSTRPEKTP